MCSTLNFTRQQWSTLAITAQQFGYRAGRQIPRNNIRGCSCSVSVVPTTSRGGKLILYRAVGGWVCLCEPPSVYNPSLVHNGDIPRYTSPLGGSPSCYHYGAQLIPTSACHPRTPCVKGRQVLGSNQRITSRTNWAGTWCWTFCAALGTYQRSKTVMADDTQTLSWWTNTITVHCTLCHNTHNTCIVMFGSSWQGSVCVPLTTAVSFWGLECR